MDAWAGGCLGGAGGRMGGRMNNRWMMDVDGWEDDGWMDDGQLDRWMKGLFLRGHAHFQTTERNLGVRGRVVGDGGRMQPGAVDRKKSTSKCLESTREESPDLLGVTDALELT